MIIEKRDREQWSVVTAYTLAADAAAEEDELKASLLHAVPIECNHCCNTD